MSDPTLLRLRVELYTAAQTLEGEDADEFWALLDEVLSIRVVPAPVPMTARPHPSAVGSLPLTTVLRPREAQSGTQPPKHKRKRSRRGSSGGQEASPVRTEKHRFGDIRVDAVYIDSVDMSAPPL